MANASSRAALAFGVGALVIGGLLVYSVVTMLGQATVRAATKETPVETVSVVVAKRRLYQGVQITNEDLDVIQVPASVLPVMPDPEDGKAVVQADVFNSRERVVGQVPRERILANEMIRPERLADGNAGVGLNAVIPRGMRAISIGLRGADAISGFLTPGNYVDILVTMADDLGRPRTETILQAVFVLGVNSRSQNDEDGFVSQRGKQAPSVTFLVTPKQAEDVAYASQLGDISLSLRNIQDVNYAQVQGTDTVILERFYRPKEEAVVVKTDRVRRRPQAKVEDEGSTVVIIRGGDRQERRVGR